MTTLVENSEEQPTELVLKLSPISFGPLSFFGPQEIWALRYMAPRNLVLATPGTISALAQPTDYKLLPRAQEPTIFFMKYGFLFLKSTLCWLCITVLHHCGHSRLLKVNSVQEACAKCFAVKI